MQTRSTATGLDSSPSVTVARRRSTSHELRAGVKGTRLHRATNPAVDTVWEEGQVVPVVYLGEQCQLGCIVRAQAVLAHASTQMPSNTLRRRVLLRTAVNPFGRGYKSYRATTRPPAGGGRTSRSSSAHEPQRHREAITCSSASDVRRKILPPGSPGHRCGTRQTIAITADGSAGTGIPDWMRPAEDIPAPKLVEAGP
jgi:hypothetical protein